MNTLTKSVGRLAFVLLMGAAISGCWAAQSVDDLAGGGDEMPRYGVITSQQALDLILAHQEDPAFVLLDLRTLAEVEASHIAGTIHLDYYGPTFRDDLALLDRDKTYLIYCRTANRTGIAYDIMEELGFERVYDMGGGITQWLAEGYPVCAGPLDAEHHCNNELFESSGSV